MNLSPTVFIVEDEPLITATINLVLSKLGFTIIGEQDNVFDAYTQITRSRPDFVLIDIKINGSLDGIDLAMRLELIHIPFFYISSLSDPVTTIKLKDTQPLGFIEKPFTTYNLKSKVAAVWELFECTIRPWRPKLREEGPIFLSTLLANSDS